MIMSDTLSDIPDHTPLGNLTDNLPDTIDNIAEINNNQDDLVDDSNDIAIIDNVEGDANVDLSKGSSGDIPIDNIIDTSDIEISEENPAEDPLNSTFTVKKDLVDSLPNNSSENLSNITNNNSSDYPLIEIKMSDKASFREQSSSFMKLLDESSKYRRKETFPEPKGEKPRKLEGLSNRPIPEEDVSPRLNRRPQQEKALSPRNMNRDPLGEEDNDPEENGTTEKATGSRYSNFTGLLH